MFAHRLFTAFVLLGLLLAGSGLWSPVPVALAEAPAHLPYRAVEILECAPSITVQNDADSGPESLRQAIADVCSGGTIDFAAGLAGRTISLTSAELTIAKSVTITNPNAPGLAISGNNARRVFHIQNGSVVTLSHLSIINGTAPTDASGGGIRNDGTLNLVNSTLSGNSAPGNGYGGGIDNRGTLSVANSTLAGNSAGVSGGGIFNATSAKLNVANSTLSGNSATNGGGIFNGGTLSVQNSTLSGNSATNGGGINNWVGGTLNLTNTLITNSPSGGDCSNNGSFGANDHNLIEGNGSACDLTDGVDGNIIGRDPLLTSLNNYGGQTETFALLPGSQAIDAGNNTACAAPVNNLDQRGIARSFGSSCDIGAVESQGFTLTNPSGNNQSAPINTAFTNPLSLTVSSSAGEPVNGGQVIFTGPGSGAGISPRVYTATISGGAAGANVTANGTTGGSYNVTAAATGATSINFALTNTLPSVSLSVSADRGTEADQTRLTLTASASSRVSGAQTVGLDIGGTGITAGDYSLSSAAITIPDGQSSGSVTFTIRDDLIDEDDETAILSLKDPSAGITLGEITSQNVRIIDNDTARIVLTPASLAVSEPDTTKVFTITLDTQPTAAVTITLASSDSGECVVPAQKVLDETTWQSGVEVIVTAVDDLAADGPQVCTITSTAASADPFYDGKTGDDIEVTVNDDDPSVRQIYLPLVVNRFTPGLTIRSAGSEAVSEPFSGK